VIDLFVATLAAPPSIRRDFLVDPVLLVVAAIGISAMAAGTEGTALRGGAVAIKKKTLYLEIYKLKFK